MKKYLLLSFVLLTSVGFGQSPWLPGKGGFYYQLSYIFVPEYNTLFTRNGDPFQMSRFAGDRTIQFYGEQGVSENLAVLVSVPYKKVKTGDLNPDFTGDADNIPESATNSAFGNTEVSLKYRLSSGKWVSAAQLRVGLPAQVEGSEASGLYPGYDAWSVAPILSLGRGWGKYFFFTWMSGIYRTNNYSDYLNGGIEGGWKPAKYLWAVTYFELMNSFKNGDRPLLSPAKQFGLYSNNNEYTAFGFKLIYEYPASEKLMLGGFAHAAGSFSGFMVAHSPLISIGVYIKK